MQTHFDFAKKILYSSSPAISDREGEHQGPANNKTRGGRNLLLSLQGSFHFLRYLNLQTLLHFFGICTRKERGCANSPRAFALLALCKFAVSHSAYRIFLSSSPRSFALDPPSCYSSASRTAGESSQQIWTITESFPSPLGRWCSSSSSRLSHFGEGRGTRHD